MNNKTVTVVLLGGIIATIFACNTKNEVVIDKEQVKKEIQTKEDEFAGLYNSGDLKNIGYYADDATSFFQNRPPLIGRESIAEFLKSAIMFKSDSIAFKTKDVFISSDGNQVVEIGYYKVLDSTNTPINTGNYMSLFEKRNGKYVCVRDMSASDMPDR